MLQGKGLWAYRETELASALQMAPNMGITHILYKVGQGPYQGKAPFYLDPPAGKAASLAQKIRNAGLTPLAWSFTTLGNPQFEADMVEWAFNDGFAGFVFDVENACSGRFTAAIELGQRLKSKGIDQTKLFLCSYPTPLSLHSDLPYNQLGAYCNGGLMPMSYGTYLQPPNVVIDNWTYTEENTWMQQQGFSLSIYPVLGFYKSDPPAQPGDWFTQAEAQQWLDRLQPYQPTFFSLFTAAVVKPEYYTPVRTFPIGAPPSPGGPRWVKDLNGAVVFGVAGGNGTQKTALLYGSQVNATGNAITTSDGARWLAISTDATSGWVKETALAAQNPGPWPALGAPPTPPPGHLVTVWSTTELNVRRLPEVRPETLAGRVPTATRLTIIQNTAQAPQWINKIGQWINVRIDPNGPQGWVAAWYVTDRDPVVPTPAGLKVEVVSPQAGFLNVRSGPSTANGIIEAVDDGAVMEALESEAEVQRKVGQAGRWLMVRTPGGKPGYAAAWYLKLHEETPIPPPPPPAGLRYVKVNSPEWGLKVRSGAGTQFEPPVWWVPHNTILESREDPAATVAKLGKDGEWLQVRTPALKEGYVAAWYLTAPDSPDARVKVDDHTLPYGQSAWPFGIHATTLGDDALSKDEIQSLYQGKAVKGWIFFTEAVGKVAAAIQPNDVLRQRLWDWAQAGYGVIVRLNHGYEPNGTLPPSQDYDGFAAACARWVELYLKRDELASTQYAWVIQIANEQNNPREHPGGAAHPVEHITPELYARAFNKAYAAIKAVLPNALVAPGAIDPYNAAFLPLLGNQRYKPLDYFQTMLINITALDAIILHAYTHGPFLERLTSLETFADPFLNDHYFDFQTYRQFAERIPAQWKDAPLYITETNHICRQPSAPLCNQEQDHGWINANIGWVRAAYAEIDRWNNTPYAQQIRALLLYRWRGDAWTLRDKSQILEDFKQALDHDYRWRK